VAEIYDPGAGSWITASPMNTIRYWHSSTRLDDGRVLVVGGQAEGTFLSSAEIYDPDANTWSLVQPMSSARQGHTANILGDRRVIVSGGSTASEFWNNSEIFDVITNTWSDSGSLYTAGFRPNSAVLPSGQVVVAGGALDSDGNMSTSEASVFDPVTGSWHFAESMSIARSHFAAALLPDGAFLVSGGWSTFANPTALAEVYLPDTDRDGVLDIDDGDDDADGIDDVVDNCIVVANSLQENRDENLIQFASLKPFDDTSNPHSDVAGDACDDDDDNDGRSDGDETGGVGCGGAVTDPLDADSDGDNYLDGPECAAGTDPVAGEAGLASRPSQAQCGATTDADGDKVLAFREVCFYNTDPSNANTDGDACNDGREVASINANNAVDVIDLQQIASEAGTYMLPGSVVKVDFDITKNGTIDVIDLQQAAGLAGACP
jgi:hypothetical protein